MDEAATWKMMSLWTAHRPCILLECNGIKILLDCAIDMDSFSSFLPCSIVKSNRISWQKKVQPYGKDAIPVLKQIGDFVFAELMPEVRGVKSNSVDLTDLDAILISNINSLIALPFLLREGVNVQCRICATDPIIQLGKLIMEDLCDMFERVDRPAGDEWCWKTISKNFQNLPIGEPEKWCEFFKREEMENCINRIQHIFFHEEIILQNMLKITPHSSGHSIGSCNWLLECGKQKICYLSASSLRHSHPKPMELTFTQLDALIVTSLSNVDESPDVNAYKLTANIIDTLKGGGNVLIPVVPSGLIYDLFECVLKAIEMNNLSRTIPVYFISSIAENSLEFANIFSEWLSDDKGSRVYKPEEPFYHSELVRSGRIRVFNSLYGAFSRECRQPCIVFAGHPSLRIGEVVHLLDLWGGSIKNAIMMVDPDYPLETYYSPYKSLAIRAYYFPIETRLDHTQLFNKVVNELSPKCVLYPEEYIPTFATTFSTKMLPIKFNHNEPIKLELEKQLAAIESVKMKSIESILGTRKRKIRIDPEIIKQMKLNVSSMQALSPINGQIFAGQEDDIKLEAKPIADSCLARRDESIEPKVREKYGGKLNGKLLMDELAKRGLETEMEQTADQIKIKFKTLLASIHISNAGKRTVINCDDEGNRKKIQSIIHDCLIKIGGNETNNKEAATSIIPS